MNYKLAYLYSHIVYKKEATVTTDTSEKAICGVLSKEGQPIIYVLRKFISMERN